MIDMFAKGEMVEVINKELQSFGLTGVIIGLRESSALVYFEDWNGRGEKELAFKLTNIKAKGEEAMAVKGNYRVALVKFIQGSNRSMLLLCSIVMLMWMTSCCVIPAWAIT